MSETTTSQQHYEPAKPPTRMTSASIAKLVVPIVAIGFILLLVYTFLSGLRSTTTPTSKTSTTPTPEAVSATSTTETEAIVGTSDTRIQTVRAGIQTDSFNTYALNLSKGWTSTHESDSSVPSDKVTLSKDDYSITISQVSTEGGLCIFPGDVEEDKSQSFESYVGIAGLNAQYRRATNDELTHVICEQQGGQFAYPTIFGNIRYNVPVNADPAILSEMDAMVASMND